MFAKGHLRKYAEVVGVPIDDVMADYYTLSRSTRAMPVVGRPKSKPPREIRLAPWLAAVVVVLVAAAAAWWWLGRVPAGTSPALSPPAMPDSRVPVQSGATAGDDAPDTTPVGAAPDPLPPVPAGSAAADAPASAGAGPGESPAARPVPAGDQAAVGEDTARMSSGSALTLTLTFSGDCWTEVTDGSGERLFFELGRDGRSVTLNGAPPFNVLLGDSTNVSLAVNGEPYTIAAADRRGDTARFTIRRRQGE